MSGQRIQDDSSPDEFGPVLEPAVFSEPEPAPRYTQPRRSNSRRSTSRTRAAGHQPSYNTGRSPSEDGVVSSGSFRSQRPLRSPQYPVLVDDDDDGEHDDPAWDNARHPDFPDRRRQHYRPPRSHLNRPSQYGDRPRPAVHNKESAYLEDDDVRDDPFLQSRPRSGRHAPATDEEMGFGYSNHRGGGHGYSPGRDIDSSGGAGGYPPRLDWGKLTREERAQVMRLPWTQWMHSSVKNHFVAGLGEFVGTTMFLFFAFAGTEVANIQSAANNSDAAGDSNTTTGEATGFDVGVLLYISLSFGFSLMVNVWVFFRISGGLFNPAVTLAMALVRAITPSRAVCLFVAQMCGALAASAMVRYLFPENFNVRTTLGGGASVVQGVFIEAILTAELVFTIFMLAKEKHRATFIAPVGIGLALFIAELVGVQFTGGSLNPARSFAPCVITTTFDKEHWIYWVGPLVGSLIAVIFYKFIKTLEYEMANPGADGDPTNDPTKNPEKRAEVAMSRSLSHAAKLA